MSGDSDTLDIDVWSDVACPWCYVGKRRLEAALERFDAADVTLTWHSFELDPNAPAAYRGDAASNLAAKYGTSEEQALEMLDRMTELGADEGLDLKGRSTRPGNTFDAHRIIRLALEHGLQGEMKERLMRAYFSEGELVSDHDVLRRLAVEVGLPEDQVLELLAGDAFSDEVRTDEYTASRLGIDGVPFFIFDRRYAVKGAQSSAHLLEALRRAHAEPPPAP